MIKPIVMPKPGNSVEECVLSRWCVKVGDTIAVGQEIADIETDKTTTEIEATEAGTVLALFWKEGDLVPVFTNIMAVGDAGEDPAPLAPNTTNLATPAPDIVLSPGKVGELAKSILCEMPEDVDTVCFICKAVEQINKALEKEVFNIPLIKPTAHSLLNYLGISAEARLEKKRLAQERLAQLKERKSQLLAQKDHISGNWGVCRSVIKPGVVELEKAIHDLTISTTIDNENMPSEEKIIEKLANSRYDLSDFADITYDVYGKPKIIAIAAAHKGKSFKVTIKSSTKYFKKILLKCIAQKEDNEGNEESFELRKCIPGTIDNESTD